MRSTLLPFIIAFAAASTAAAFNTNTNTNTNSPTSQNNNLPPPSTTTTRREALTKTVALAFLATTTTAAVSPPPPPANAAVVRGLGRCANGEGDGCDVLSEDNEFIRRLQRRNSENREANEWESLNAFYMKNYPDVFVVSNKKMVTNDADGSFALYSPEEVARLTAEGRIRIEYPTSKGGRIADVT